MRQLRIFGVTGLIWWVLWSFELQYWCHLYSCRAYFWYNHWIGKCHRILLAFLRDATVRFPYKAAQRPHAAARWPSLSRLGCGSKTNQFKFVWLVDLWVIASGATSVFSCKVNSSVCRLTIHPRIYHVAWVWISPKCQRRKRGSFDLLCGVAMWSVFSIGLNLHPEVQMSQYRKH